MERAVVQLVLFSLLLASVSALPNKDDWQIYSFHINSTVISRYATTVVTSRVVNRVNESREIEFQVRIPKNAFISKFTMLIDNKVYDGVVKAKEQAERQYTEAVSRGQSAGLVSSVGRTLEEFKTSVTVAALKKVTFELTYEELLKRTLGKYELQIHARPMQPVRDFKANVYIHEDAGINFMEVKGGLSTQAMGNAITKTVTKTQAWVSFYPTEDQQKTCDRCGEHGMNGDLVMVYDVDRDRSLGHILRSSGYFVHHFAPSGLPRIAKNVVFVIDQSGSMHGQKMTQTRSALLRIFSDLAEDDFFGLITFDGSVSHWKRELVQATTENVDSARKFAQGIGPQGATNINSALLEGAQKLNAHPREGSASILILLTDGDPTSGVTNEQQIQANVKRAIADKFPLYCLGFGFDVRFEFLEKMSLQNNGVARRIYEDSDADLQLKGFYEEVATPLLTDVMMIYNGGSNLTQTNFSQYYNGSEIVVAGQITDNNVETFVPQVVATSNNKPITFGDTNKTTESTEGTSDSHIQRVWAYLTVKQLLERELQLSGPEKEKVKNKAMELSLKYSFVTPLTSMVVTKPTGEDVLHKPKEGDAPAGRHGLQGGHALQGRHGLQAPLAYPQPSLHTRLLSSTPLQAGSSGQRRKFYAPTMGSPRGSGVQGAGGLPLDSVEDYDHYSFMTKDIVQMHAGLPVHVPFVPATAPAPVSPAQRFLLKSEDQSLPLCFDVNGGILLNLLKHPSGDFSVNGALDPLPGRGFNRIVVHFGPEHFVDVDAGGVSVTEGPKRSRFTGEELIMAGSVTVIIRVEEFDIAIGDTRLALLRHVKDGHRFLWPVLRQKPSVQITEGILAVQPDEYSVVQTLSFTKLRMNNKETDVTRSTASDYSISFSPSLECWLMPAESALQRELEDFIVAKL